MFNVSLGSPCHWVHGVIRFTVFLGSVGVALVIFGITKARESYGRSIELYIAALGLELAGIVLLIASL